MARAGDGPVGKIVDDAVGVGLKIDGVAAAASGDDPAMIVDRRIRARPDRIGGACPDQRAGVVVDDDGCGGLQRRKVDGLAAGGVGDHVVRAVDDTGDEKPGIVDRDGAGRDVGVDAEAVIVA
ncbi:MAG TPA: hypothetical protein VHJ79_20050 [Mycobacterium sp.]|nr:hypothetical protein [Mycobacterium sp.]